MDYPNLHTNLLNTSAIVIICWKNEENWPVDFVTENILEFCGYTQKEISIGKVSYFDCIHLDDLNGVIHEMKAGVDSGERAFSLSPFRLLTKPGKQIWVNQQTICRHDDHGTITHLEGTLQNVSEYIDKIKKLEKEKELSESSETKYKIFAQASFEALFISENGYCVEQNKAASEMFGYTNEEAEGMFATAIVADICKETVIENIKKGYKKPYDIVAVRKNGETFNAEIHGADLILDGKKMRITAIRNITNRKQSELELIENRKELKKSNDSLKSTTQFLRTVNDFTNQLQAVASVDEVVWKLVDILMSKFHFEDCVVYLLDENKKDLIQVAANGEKLPVKKDISSPLKLKIGEGIVGSSAKSLKPINVKDTSIDIRYVVDDANRLSELSVPIVFNGELIGVIDSEHAQKNYFTQEHVDVLSTIAQISASRLKNLIAKKELKESELKHRLIFENAKDAILLIRNGVFVDCNNVAIEMFGCTSQDQIVGKSPIVFSPKAQYNNESSSALAEEKINKAKSGKSQTFEWIHCKPNGDTFDAEVSLNAFDFKNKMYIQAMVRNVSERKELHESLAKSEALYRSLIEITDSVAYVLDMESKTFTFISSTIEDVSGYKRSDWTNFDFWKSCIHPEDREDAASFCLVRTKAGENHSFEYRMVKADGSIAWIRDVVNVVKVNGKVTTLKGYLIDITLQRKSELIKAEYTKKLQGKVDELYASREEYKSLFNESLVSLWEADYTKAYKDLMDLKASGVTDIQKYFEDHPNFVFECLEGVKIIRANYASAKVFKAENIETLISRFDELVTVNNLAHFIDAFVRLFNGEIMFTLNTSFNNFKNELLYGVVKYYFIQHDGQLTANISIINETERVEAEQELFEQNQKLVEISNKLSNKNHLLEESQTRFENLFEKSPVSLMEEDISEVLTLILAKNKEVSNFEDYVNQTPSFVNECISKIEVINLNEESLSLFGVESKEAMMDHMWVSFNEKSVETFKKQMILLAKGERRFTHESEFVKRGGELIYVILNLEIINDSGIAILSIIDVSALKRAETDLISAKNKAEESDKLKSEFLNNISHEIRTPLNGIIGFSSFLSDRSMTDDMQNQYVSIIQNSGNQLIRIIDEILEISKLESKEELANVVRVDINDLLFELGLIFKLIAKDKKLDFTVSYGLPNSDSTILTDETKLNKILSNILQNAFKFTQSGSIEVGYTQENEWIIFYVKDTGMGISANKIDRIFERFAQEDENIGANFGGLGLGLSIVKEHVDLLKGEISVQSVKGEGSTFTIKIPYHEVAMKIETKKDSEVTLSTSKSRTVLLVEDDEVNALLMKRLLQKTGLFAQIIHASNGQEAIDYCTDNLDIDVVLMDIGIPIINGFDATIAIKKMRPNLPVIAQTAYSTAQDKCKIDEAGCDDFISKPIDYNVLIPLIEKYLN